MRRWRAVSASLISYDRYIMDFVNKTVDVQYPIDIQEIEVFFFYLGTIAL